MIPRLMIARVRDSSTTDEYVIQPLVCYTHTASRTQSAGREGDMFLQSDNSAYHSCLDSVNPSQGRPSRL